VGFPETQNLLLIQEGHDIKLKTFALNTSLKTHCWYSAYPHLTLLNILNNSQIRQGLNADLDDDSLAAWLGLF